MDPSNEKLRRSIDIYIGPIMAVNADYNRVRPGTSFTGAYYQQSCSAPIEKCVDELRKLNIWNRAQSETLLALERRISFPLIYHFVSSSQTKIYSILQAKMSIPKNHQNNSLVTYWVILQTNQQTNAKHNLGEGILLTRVLLFSWRWAQWRWCCRRSSESSLTEESVPPTAPFYTAAVISVGAYIVK